MSAQADTNTAVTLFWTGWQSVVINGVYPLQRLLHGSEHSAVFLSECKGLGVANVAVKIIPIEQVTLAQLSHWRLATGLSHPHLVQLFDAGLCQLGGQPHLFVVMEYAEQTLSQVLGQRALTVDEVREMLPPTLDALAFLHRQGLVQSRLKPANVLVVNDQLKLATDGIRPVGAPRVGTAEPSLYDPPEAIHTPYSAAADIWGLGITLVEALTQVLPLPDEKSRVAGLPKSVPLEFFDMVQRCLSYNPATRPSATELQVQLGCAPAAPPVTVLQTVVREAPQAAPIPNPPKPRGPMAARVAIVFLILLAAVWADLRLFRTDGIPAQPAVAAQTSAPRPTAAVESAAQNPVAHPPGSGVVQQPMPNVSRRALGTIHGRIRIAVLVVVDHSGAVIAAHLKNTGPSAYFARLAREAAKKWTFVPVADSGNRQWVLQFEFTRGGATGVATPVS